MWVSHYRCPIWKSSNRTPVIGDPCDCALITWQIGTWRTNQDQKYSYRYNYYNNNNNDDDNNNNNDNNNKTVGFLPSKLELTRLSNLFFYIFGPSYSNSPLFQSQTFSLGFAFHSFSISNIFVSLERSNKQGSSVFYVILLFRPLDFLECDPPVDFTENATAREESGYGCTKVSSYNL